MLVLLVPLALWVNLRRLESGEARSHIARGVERLSAHKLDEAEKEWLTALRLDPSQVEPYRLLTEYYITVGHPERSLPLLERLQQIAPGTPNLYSRLAEAYALTGNEQKSLAAAKTAVEKEPANPNAHALLGIHLANRADTRGAIVELDKAVLLAPTNAKIATTLAQAQLDAGDFASAESTVRKVLVRSPNYVTAWYVLGWSYSRRAPTRDNAREAIHAFEELLKLDPKRGDGYAELGRLCLMQGNAQGAEKALLVARQLLPNEPDVTFNLSAAYRKMGETKQAEQFAAEFKQQSDYATRFEALKKTLSVSPNNVEAALQMAELQIGARRYSEAQPLMQAILQRLPEDPRALAAAVNLYKGVGEMKAVKFYEQRLRSLKR